MIDELAIDFFVKSTDGIGQESVALNSFLPCLGVKVVWAALDFYSPNDPVHLLQNGEYRYISRQNKINTAKNHSHVVKIYNFIFLYS